MLLQNNRFIIADKVKKMIFFVDDLLINYPRKELVLRDKIEKGLYELLELIYYANTKEDRLDLQKQIISKISMLDFYFEISYKKKIINEKKLNVLCRSVEELKKMIYGWVKSDGSESK